MNRRHMLSLLAMVPCAALVPTPTLAFRRDAFRFATAPLPMPDDAPLISAMLARLQPGETLNLKAGIYHIASPIRFSQSHTTLEHGVFYSGADVVFDFGDVEHSTVRYCHVYGNGSYRES